jgi:hypothetical protein
MLSWMLVIIRCLGQLVHGSNKEEIILHKFGSTGIVTGYIKQLLATFNLPKTRIYTKEYEKFYEEHNVESPYVLESFDDLNKIVPEASKVLFTEYPAIAQEITKQQKQLQDKVKKLQEEFDEELRRPDISAEEIEQKRFKLESDIQKEEAECKEVVSRLEARATLGTQKLKLLRVVKQPGKPDQYLPANLEQVQEKSYIPYIKEGRIQFLRSGYYNSDAHFVPGDWQSEEIDVSKAAGGNWQVYDRGKYYRNLTKQLQIKNNIYDSYTHEYLGEYLRFIRDYDGIDLMPLYNCFSNNICPGGSKLTFRRATDDTEITFDASDDRYKIYMIPVKLFKNYTIALDSNTPIELACGCFNVTAALSAGLDKLLTSTYVKKTQVQFGQPFLYTALTDIAPKQLPKFPTYEELAAHAEARKFLAQVAPRESELKLFLKVPKDVTSSIVILEGDYRNWSDQIVSREVTTTGSETSSRLVLKYNHTILDNTAIFSDLDLKLITPLQLLRLNTETHMPFADRLLEYLVDACITGGDAEVAENVLMAQTLAGMRYNGQIEKGDYYVKPLAGEPDKIQIINVKSTEQECTKIGDIYLTMVPHPTTPKNPYCSRGYCQHVKRLTGLKPRSFVDLGPAREFLPNAKETKVRPEPLNYNLANGVWSPALQRIFYNYMTNTAKYSFATHKDLLGYVDKDVEKAFTAVVSDKSGKTTTKTMLNFDTWEDIKE